MSLFRNRTIVGVGCILISLLICFGITPMFNRGITNKTEIVRVVKEIKEGDKITKDMIQTVEVGSYNLSDNVIKSKDTVVGCYALADLSEGDYIINSKVSKTPLEDNSYLYDLDGSRQAISITLKNFANGLSGKLESGDIVSVIAADYKKQGDTVIPMELQYVEVISVTTSSGYDTNTGKEKESDKELPSTATLLVTPEQGNILASLEVDGECHLSLVYRGEAKCAKEFLDVQDKVLAELYTIKQSEVSSDTSIIDENVEEE